MNVTKTGIRPLAGLGILFVTFAICITSYAGTTSPRHDVEAQVGKSFTLSLSDNPSTGFSWMLAKLPSSLLLSDVEFIPPSGPPVPGKPGQRVFTFVPQKAGGGDLQFVQVRPQEPTQPSSTTTFHVHVVRGSNSTAANR